MLFGTADFDRVAVRTGDPSAERALVNGTWYQQQAAGLRRMIRMSRRKRRPHPETSGAD
jgi:hypothetical protein